MERRTCASAIRAEDKDGKKIAGYFAVFDSRYYLWNKAYETVGRHAFDGELDGDVRALINHDATLVLGRTKAGTLRLSVDDTGLYGEIDINDKDSDAVNLYERVKRGDVSQCSFGFEIIKESYERDDNDETHWTLETVKLYEVSPCTFPAYADTSVSARSADDPEAVREISRRKYQDWKSRTEERINKWH